MASEDKFQELMDFLKKKKAVTKSVLHKQEISGDKSKTHSCYVTGQTFTVQQLRGPPRYPKNVNRLGKAEPLCIACKGTKNPEDAKTLDCRCCIDTSSNSCFTKIAF